MADERRQDIPGANKADALPETSVTSGNVGGGNPGRTTDKAGWGDDALRENLPAQIGHYKIIKKLGRGGMGIVLLGVRDDDQFHKRVAIKLIRRGIDSSDDGREVLKRFDLERQVLGALNHPNIARLLDAGQMPDPDGRPYFVMEYVEGEPIDEYCDRMQLTTEQRLALFQKVCAAVHHAHQNLVVHRDIKPSNILVDTNNEPKLMDFGIVKLLNPAMAGVTLATSWKHGPMTPEYASPEQVQGKPISTVSDVYALGVLLYELLTGRRPYKLRSKAVDAMAKAICEDDPERPSTVVMHEVEVETGEGETRTVTADTLAKPREGAATRLRRRLAGDVDNIVLMAMRKSPQRRYASAEAMASDIQRHLDGQPVTAAPDSVVYRAGKFVRRNKMGVGAAVVVAGALVAGLGMAEYGRRRAEHGESLLRVANFEIEAANKKVEVAKAEYELVFGSYFQNLGTALRKLGGTTEARLELATAILPQLEHMKSSAGDDHGVLRVISQNYATVSDLFGGERGGNTGEPSKSRSALEKAIAISAELASKYPDEPENRRVHAANLIRLGDLRKKVRGMGDPLDAYDQAVRTIQAKDGSDPIEVSLQRIYSIALVSRGDEMAMQKSSDAATRAGADYEKALAIRRKRFEAHSDDPEAERDLTTGLNRIAGWYASQEGKENKAQELYERALRIREGALARDPNARTKRDTLVAAEAVARFYLDRGNADGAAAPITQARRLADDLEKTDSDSARVDEDLGMVALDEGDLATLREDHTLAAGRFADSVERARAGLKRDGASAKARYTLAHALLSLAGALETLGKKSEALRDLREAHPIWGELNAEGKRAVYADGLNACNDAIKRLAEP